MPDASTNLKDTQAKGMVGPDRHSGEVVYIFAYDIAYEMAREPLRTLLGFPVAQFQVDASKRTPRQLFFYRPQMVRLPPLERIGSNGPIRLEMSVKILPVGAISITVRVPFENQTLESLVEYHDLKFNNGASVYDEVLQTVEAIQKELQPYLHRPVAKLANEEAYTVFCLNAPVTREDASAEGAEDWLALHRREVAALLTEEFDLAHLSDQEADESTQKYLSYYDHDLVVVDWDAALIVDEPRYVDETLYLMELANLQLAELEAYDRILDDVIDRSYRDLSGRRAGSGSRRRTQHDLREIRIDLARLSDELSNITKFFGDWHLARIYKALSDRFHLSDWHHTIDDKLKTLDDLYQLLQSDRNNRWMLILEVTVVLLFIIDLLILFTHGR
jgi:hypothetical protein